MAMDLKKLFNYQNRLFLVVNIFLWMLVFAFVSIQYLREHEYKVGLLDAEMQSYNRVLLHEYKTEGKIDTNLINECIPNEKVRVTLVRTDGTVIFDNNFEKLANHRNRQEIQRAIETGRGVTVRRISESDRKEYFYSATAGDGVIVRTAIPYDLNLSKILSGEFEYIWVILGIAGIVNIILYFALGRIGSEVKSLKHFAEQAEKGDIEDYDVSVFSKDELGEVSAVIVKMYLDLKRVSKERDKSIDEALFEEKEKIRIKHQLTSNINHELKTPVQAISGCFETLLSNELDEEIRRKLLESGYANSVRLTNLLSDVTLITRITDDKDSLPLSEVNILEVIKEISKETDGYSIEKRMRINIEVPDNVVIRGSRQLVDAIFRNLVSNAVSYSGGRDIFITMTRETSDYYWFDFYDNGAGVEEKHLDKIFERFYRVDAGRSRKNGGTGLGLSIVRNAVAFHKGEIQAMNRKFAGLEFVFSLHK